MLGWQGAGAARCVSCCVWLNKVRCSFTGCNTSASVAMQWKWHGSERPNREHWPFAACVFMKVRTQATHIPEDITVKRMLVWGFCVRWNWGGLIPRQRVWQRRQQISLCHWKLFIDSGEAEMDPNGSLGLSTSLRVSHTCRSLKTHKISQNAHIMMNLFPDSTLYMSTATLCPHYFDTDPDCLHLTITFYILKALQQDLFGAQDLKQPFSHVAWLYLNCLMSDSPNETDLLCKMVTACLCSCSWVGGL